MEDLIQLPHLEQKSRILKLVNNVPKTKQRENSTEKHSKQQNGEEKG